jgi:hypothetical protein
MKMGQTECSETSAYRLQTPGINPKERTQQTEQGESLESTTFYAIYNLVLHFKNDFLPKGMHSKLCLCPSIY